MQIATELDEAAFLARYDASRHDRPSICFPVAFTRLPERFTPRAPRQVHEAIGGRPLTTPAFRRRLLGTGWLAATGERAARTSYRPPELYRYRPPQGEPTCH